MTDDSLLHEMVWSAESLVAALKNDRALIGVESARALARLERGIAQTHKYWSKDPQGEDARVARKFIDQGVRSGSSGGSAF